MLADAALKSKWNVQPRRRDAEQKLADALGIPSILCASLVARGLEGPDEADEFLNPDLDRLHDPMLLPDAEAAVAQILLAKDRGERIYVHGDYDVDGVSSTAIWTRCLRDLGFDVMPHVPHRMREGYGIHQIAVQEAIDAGAKLFLTCDCGTGAIDSLEKARQSGMTVIITDHHELGARLPAAHAFVNAHRPDSTYPFPELCGAGVAFKMAQAVAEACGAKRSQFTRAFLDLVCLGTIADIVPLTGENRILAYHGLKALSRTKKVGLKALNEVSKVDLERGVSAHDVGFRLGPRINAAGRVDDAALSLDLLLTDDEARAKTLADELDAHNLSRRQEESRILDHALELIAEHGYSKDLIIFLAAPGWHPGVVGIVASRILERYYRPILLACIDSESGIARGSARSIPEFNLHESLQAHREMFLSCGGHARAAGFSLDAAMIDGVRSKLRDYASEFLVADELMPSRWADAEVDPSEIDLAAIKSLERLEPFGEANHKAAFVMRKCKLPVIKPTANPEHIQFFVDCKTRVKGIGFRMAEKFEGITSEDCVDLLFEPKVDRWNNGERPELVLTDLQLPEPD
jgi:single-stranded-DNA-specific exonuclease